MHHNHICGKYRGFFKFYAIDERGDNDKEDRHRWTGLKSPFGRRGSICSHLHWTWNYLHHDISWATVQRMLIDAPKYEAEKKETTFEVTEENEEQMMKMLNNIR